MCQIIKPNSSLDRIQEKFYREKFFNKESMLQLVMYNEINCIMKIAKYFGKSVKKYLEFINEALLTHLKPKNIQSVLTLCLFTR